MRAALWETEILCQETQDHFDDVVTHNDLLVLFSCLELLSEDWTTLNKVIFYANREYNILVFFYSSLYFLILFLAVISKFIDVYSLVDRNDLICKLEVSFGLWAYLCTQIHQLNFDYHFVLFPPL